MKKFNAYFEIEVMHGPRTEEFIEFIGDETDWVTRSFIRVKLTSQSGKVTIDLNIFKDYTPMWFEWLEEWCNGTPKEYPIKIETVSYNPYKASYIRLPVTLPLTIYETSHMFIIKHHGERIEFLSKHWDPEDISIDIDLMFLDSSVMYANHEAINDAEPLTL